AGESRAVRRPPSSAEGSCPGEVALNLLPLPHSHKVSAHQALVPIPRDRRPCGQRNWQATRAWLQRTNLWRERTNLKPRTRSVQKIIQGYSTSGAVHSSALVKKLKTERR